LNQDSFIWHKTQFEIGMNEIKQHTAIQSILLHLLPGVFILVSILVFSQPFFPSLLSVHEDLGPVIGYLMALLIGLLPVQMGILLFANKKETGKLGFSTAIQYTKKSPIKQYLLLVPVFIIFFLVLFIAIAPLIQPYIVRTFFAWWPEQYNFQLIMQNPSTLAGYKGIMPLLSIYILLSCISGPLVEELYFRGYLLPRMENYAGKWAPLLNAVLFSTYHFFSPWENLVRIAAMYPVVHTVWRKKDIRFGIFTHILTNTLGGLFMFFMILNT
jgi:CAAX protease family protein